jgi:PKD repeat protein
MRRKYSQDPKVLWFMGLFIFTVVTVFASITYIPSHPEMGEEVVFTVIPPSGTIMGSVEWDFGDGATQKLPPPTARHKYMSPGTYTVKATYATSTQVFPTDTQIVVVREGRFISFSPADPRVNESVTFKAHHFLSNQIKWDFGDGTIITQGKQTAYRTYKTPGTYTVKAWDYYGQQGIPGVEVQLIVTPDLRTLSYSPTPAFTDQEIIFTATNFRSQCIKWDFGDGTIKEKGSSKETHIYKKEGSYPVKAYDHCGQDKYPKSITLNVLSRTGMAAPFQISFVQLRFEDGKSYQQVAKGFQPLLVFADMKYEGTGIFKAQWMVDGQTFQPVSLSLSAKGQQILSLGKETPLPTQVPGIHEVTLNIIQPQVQYSIPKLRYFVSTGEIEKRVDVSISHVQDLEGNKVSFQENRLSLSPSKHYLLSGTIQNLTENEIPSCFLQVSLEGHVVDQQKVKKLGPGEKKSFETSILSDMTGEQKLIFRVFDMPAGKKLLTEREWMVSSLPRPELMREITPREGLRKLEGPPVALEVLSPNGGEHYYKGGLYRIRWIGAEEVGEYVRIELWKDENPCMTIENSTENDGILRWLVPDHLETGYHLYRVRIESISGDFMDQSDREFFIFPEESEMRVIVPNGGETWYKKQSYEIKWCAKGVGDLVNLELIRGSGPTEGLLVSRIGQMDNDENLTISHGRYTGTYNWIPPEDLLIGDFMIRVSGIATPEVNLTDVYDESDESFRIEEEFPIVNRVIELPLDSYQSGSVSLDSTHTYYNCTTTNVDVGDHIDQSSRRGIIAYDLSVIPEGAWVFEAWIEMDISKCSIWYESDPFSDLGNFQVVVIPLAQTIISFSSCVDNNDACRLAYTMDGDKVYNLHGPPRFSIPLERSVSEAYHRGDRWFFIRLQFQVESDRDETNDMVTFFRSGCILYVRIGVE